MLTLSRKEVHLSETIRDLPTLSETWRLFYNAPAGYNTAEVKKRVVLKDKFYVHLTHQLCV